MKAKSNAAFELEREAMSSAERELLKRDLNWVIDEYFERDDGTDIDVTKTRNGYSVCVLFKARRIKKMRSPQ